MSIYPIILSSAFADVAEAAGAITLAQQDHGYGHGGPPPPDSLKGSFSFTDWRGKQIGDADFRNRWTLLYFGYSRCSDSCPMAIPAIVSAAKLLRDGGVDARAAFVDIESPPLGLNRRSTGKSAHKNHVSSAHLDQLRAMKAIANSFGDGLMVLTGSRAQLSLAGASFRVAREHIPPRPAENHHSINHSTMIYFIAPTTKVAGYGYHDASPPVLAKAVRALAAKRA